jgi:hypothetical protein
LKSELQGKYRSVLKKDGLNKSKKLRAMKEKEASAKPEIVRTGTGSWRAENPYGERASGRYTSA